MDEITTENRQLPTGTGRYAGIHTDFLHLVQANWFFINLGIGLLVVPSLLHEIGLLIGTKHSEADGLLIVLGWLIAPFSILFGWLTPAYADSERDWQKQMTTLLEKVPEQDTTIYIDTYAVYRSEVYRVTSIEADGTTPTYRLACTSQPFRKLPRKKKIPVKVVRYEVGHNAIFIGDTFRLWCRADSEVEVPDVLKVHHYNKY